jgi:hypothetical protein
MKKLVLMLTAIAATFSFANAQGLSGGLKAGVNFANQKVEFDGGSLSADALTSFHVGGYLTFGVSEKFGVQPELLLNMVGSKSDDIESKATYISVPVLAKFSPAPIFNIHVGPQFGFLMSAKTDGEDVKDSYKGLDLGAAIGAGVDLPMGLNFTARYVLGLSNIADMGDDSGDYKVKNNVFQISVGYKLFGGE